jgi:DNA invertase Pin-like site-specific DNA recombinase
MEVIYLERIIQRVGLELPTQPKAKRVAAYARVSSGKDAMLHSLSAQVSYYSNLIQKHPGWLYCGVFSDEALTGTKENRDEFQKLLAECRAGNIDLIITKSISRFARNTVVLLQTVRELKSMGVDIYFEEQNIHSMSADGELMLTILASYAQEESLSASTNQKWRIKKNFEDGMPWNGTVLGYRYEDGQYMVIPEEAEIVRRIFDSYLAGTGCPTIAKHLNEDGIPTRRGNTWRPNSVQKVLRNYSYTGNLLLQTTFCEDHLTKKMKPNQGELPMYHAEGTHEAIIGKEQFQAVQEMMEEKARNHPSKGLSHRRYPFTGLLVCGNCGKHYRRKMTRTGPVWICGTFNVYGKAACPSKQVPESTLETVARDTLGIEKITAATLHDKITAIRVESGNRLVFCFMGGTETVKRWADRSRAESWTPEMKAAARDKAKKQREDQKCQK